MKILFLVKYYDGLVESLEQKIDKSLSYEECHDRVLDLLSSLLVPYIKQFRELGQDSKIIIYNFKTLQKKWCEENNVIFDENWKYSVPIKQIKKEKPDILFLSSIFDYYGSFLNEVKPFVKKTCAWISCPFDKNTINLSNIDLVFTLFKPHYDYFVENNIPTYFTNAVFDESVLKELKEEKKYDLTFIGGIGGYHKKREKYLKKLIKKTPIKVWGYGYRSKNPIKNFLKQLLSGFRYKKVYQGEAWGIDMLKIIAQSKITFNSHGDIAKGHAVNMRMFEATGVGSLLITDYADNITDFYEPDKEIICYKNMDEAIEKINYYLKHDEERKKIALAGQKKTLENYTYKKKAKEYLNVFENLLNNKLETPSKKIKILLLTPWYTKNMGYNNVLFPDALSKIENVEVHILTSQAQVYYSSHYYKQTYEKFHGKPILPSGTEKLNDSLFLHRVEFKVYKTEIIFKSLYKHIKHINPDIIQTFDCNSFNTFKLALFKPFLKYKLFTGNSIVLSIFPLEKEWENMSILKKIDWKIKHVLPGKFISKMSNKIYPSTVDAGYIAEKYFGAKKSKIEISPLGVDTFSFKPCKDINFINEFRKKLGFNKDDFICIYTGRMTNGKNPLLLAKAVEWINKNTNFKVKGLFLGEGEQKNKIENYKDIIVLDFKQYKELPQYYQISDIGVWPTQESTSMLDAAACGLPIIVSDRLKAVERVEGNGLQYKENDHIDLASKIISLIKDENLYNELSEKGVQKMNKEFSWMKIANSKIIEYEKN